MVIVISYNGPCFCPENAKVAPPRRRFWGQKSEERRPILDIRPLIELEKTPWVTGRKDPLDGMQKKGADASAETKEKYFTIVDTGQRAEPGTLGSGTERRRS